MNELYVYILTNRNRTTLYIGVTNDIERRLFEHRAKTGSKFSSRYALTVLLHVKHYPDPLSAIAREKQLKGWRREKKVKLIEKENPRWIDLSESWFDNRR